MKGRGNQRKMDGGGKEGKERKKEENEDEGKGAEERGEQDTD